MAYPLGRARRWTRAEYDSLISQGIFDRDERIELLGGDLVAREPQSSYHFTTVALAARVLERAFGAGWTVRQQGPVALDSESEPEPDLGVVRGVPIDFLEAHPARPVLVVEVSEASLDADRDRKGALYARAGLADYWIVNLRERCLEVYREPTPDAARPPGWRYASRQVLVAGDTVVPLGAPGRPIPVADLLPPSPGGSPARDVGGSPRRGR